MNPNTMNLGAISDLVGHVPQARHRFYDDPVGFAERCIRWPVGQRLTKYQREVLGAIPKRRKVSVRGPHGCAKTCSAALAVLWFATTREASGVDWKIATTAGAWRQLEHFLWPEIAKWARRIDWNAAGCAPWSERTELLSLNIKLRHGQAFAAASDNPALIEGAHADSIMYVFDESKSIAADTFDAAEGAFSGVGEGSVLEAYALACSTPGEPVGRFFDIHTRKAGLEDWWTRHVTVKEAIAAGRISRDWVDQRGLQWGKDSAVYANRVLGEFHTSDSDGVIPLEWVEAANLRWQAWDDAGRPSLPGARTVGVDVARSGADQTVMAILDGCVITGLRRTSREDTMMTTGRVQGIVSATPGRVPIVDVIGVGGGVVDRLRELKITVVAFNASEATELKDRSGELGFVNKRAGAWWRLRELLDPAYGAELALPPDDLLTGDLTAPHWKVMSGGRIQIESKDEIRKRIGRSPDSGDAVMQAVWDAQSGSQGAIWLQAMKNRAESDGITVPTLARSWRTTLADHRAGRPGAARVRSSGPDRPPATRNG